MISLNLFPWREARRRYLRRNLLFTLLLAAIAAIVLTVIWQFAVKQSLADAEARVAYLQQQESGLTVKIKQTRDLDKQKRELLQRLAAINQLQANRGLTAQVFNILPTIIPDDVYLTSWQRTANQFTLVGKAHSNADIAEFMRKLTAVSQFKNPILREIKAPGDSKDAYSTFTLDITVANQAGGQ